MAEYCFDTSSIIHAWVRTYPPENFPTFWARFDTAISSSLIVSPEDVRQELAHPEDLKNWAKQRDQMFRELDNEIQESLKEILRHIKSRLERDGLTFREKDLKADPIVVATARVTRATVVVQETRRGGQGRPKIPDLCDHFEVPFTNLLGFIQSRNWKF